MCKDDECEEGEIKETGEHSPLRVNRPHIDRPLTPPSICRFYLRGTCTWGGNCRYHHPGISDAYNCMGALCTLYAHIWTLDDTV